MKPPAPAALLLSCGAIAATIILEWRGSAAYAVVLGVDRPVASMVAACLLGLAGLRILQGRRWCPSAGASRESYRMAIRAGALLPIPMLIVDVLGGFPLALNAPAPDSLLFYPAVALVAEFIFHVTPLAIVAAATAAVPHSGARGLTIGMVLAAISEPVFQVVWGTGDAPSWVLACVGVQVLIFNIIGLRLFRRHGFLVVYLYRLTYYAIWHIAWGYLRLGLLFGA